MDIQPFAGIDVTEVEKLLGNKIGKKTKHTFTWSEEVIIANYIDPFNPFHWTKIVLNLPDLLKWNDRLGSIAAFFTTYIDNIRSRASSEEACRRVSARIAARINYLGQQDASRKRGRPAQSPCPWARGLIKTIPNKGIFVLTTQAKWDKAEAMINALYDDVVVNKLEKICYKRLDREVEFLCHLTRTYYFAFPYLKGYYNSLNRRQFSRDVDGWEMGRTAWLELMVGDIAFGNEEDINLSFEARKRKFASIHTREDKPSHVMQVPKLGHDFTALKALFYGHISELRLV